MAHVERNSSGIIARLKREGWDVVSQRGSHVKMRNAATGSMVVVPHPKKDLPLGTSRKIAKQAGWLE